MSGLSFGKVKENFARFNNSWASANRFDLSQGFLRKEAIQAQGPGESRVAALAAFDFRQE